MEGVPAPHPSFGLRNLNADALSIVLGFCSARECCRLATVNRAFCEASRAGNLWKKWAEESFKVNELRGPRGEPCAGWRQVYLAWLGLFKGRDLSRCLVAVKFWNDFKVWAAGAFPEMLPTLRPGVTHEELAEIEGEFGMPLPDELAALYLLHDGQRDPRPDSEWHRRRRPASRALQPQDALGMFGTALVYDHFTTTVLLPLRSALAFTGAEANTSLWPCACIFTFAASFLTSVNKMIGVDCRTGEVLGLCLQLRPRTANLVQGGSEPSQLCRWLKTYTERLQSGTYVVRDMHDMDSMGYLGLPPPGKGDAFKCIHLFPEAGPLVGELVTRGVKVRASVLIQPELTSPHGTSIAYCVRYSHVLPAGAAIPLGMEAEAQLATRHWRCCARDGSVIDEIKGAGVVGLHPHVKPGCKEIVYQSKTFEPEFGSYMDGSFLFVAGTLSNPTGPSFEVKCPRLCFDHPGCIY